MKLFKTRKSSRLRDFETAGAAEAYLLKDEKAILQELPLDFLRFNNEVLGRPLLPDTLQPHELAQYQIDIGRQPHKDDQDLKANKIGVTETRLREAAWRGTVGDCRGYQMMIGAQDRELAKNNLARLRRLFENSEILRPFVPPHSESSKLKLTLKPPFNTTYFVMPSSEYAFRGWELVKWIFLDEAAHLGQLDDEPYLNAAITRLANTNGYLRVSSTPNGPRGFFYRRTMDSLEPGSRIKLNPLPYQLGVDAGLISMDFIDDMRAKLGPWFEQEFELKFLASQFAAMSSDLIDSQTADGLEGRPYYTAEEY